MKRENWKKLIETGYFLKLVENFNDIRIEIIRDCTKCAHFTSGACMRFNKLIKNPKKIPDFCDKERLNDFLKEVEKYTIFEYE